MTELLEKVAVMLEARMADQFCDNKKSDSTGWKANIHELDGGKGDPEVLKGNLLKAGVADPIEGDRPRKLPSGGWDLHDCDWSHFPCQTHHLVPKKQLSEHPVTFWLVKNSGKTHPKYTLAADTNYDTDNEANGYFMPFASTTDQWTSMASKQTAICDEMMRRTRRQLHQGNHTFTNYGEEDDSTLEHSSYKGMVKRLLQVIDVRTAAHVETCGVCKESGKPEIQPLEAVVRHMYRVSGMMKALLRLNKVHVSRRAYNYFAKNQQGGKLVHPSSPIV